MTMDNNTAIMINIPLEQCEKILNGELDFILLRNPSLKIKPPFKIYIYADRDRNGKYSISVEGQEGPFKTIDMNKFNLFCAQKKVIAECICNMIVPVYLSYSRATKQYFYSTNKWTKGISYSMDDIIEYFQLDTTQIELGDTIYSFGALHIANLKIYKEPKKVSEFSFSKIIRGYHKKETKESKSNSVINIDYLQHCKRVEVHKIMRGPAYKNHIYVTDLDWKKNFKKEYKNE